MNHHSHNDENNKSQSPFVNRHEKSFRHADANESQRIAQEESIPHNQNNQDFSNEETKPRAYNNTAHYEVHQALHPQDSQMSQFHSKSNHTGNNEANDTKGSISSNNSKLNRAEVTDNAKNVEEEVGAEVAGVMVNAGAEQHIESEKKSRESDEDEEMQDNDNAEKKNNEHIQGEIEDSGSDVENSHSSPSDENDQEYTDENSEEDTISGKDDMRGYRYKTGNFYGDRHKYPPAPHAGVISPMIQSQRGRVKGGVEMPPQNSTVFVDQATPQIPFPDSDQIGVNPSMTPRLEGHMYPPATHIHYLPNYPIYPQDDDQIRMSHVRGRKRRSITEVESAPLYAGFTRKRSRVEKNPPKSNDIVDTNFQPSGDTMRVSNADIDLGKGTNNRTSKGTTTRRESAVAVQLPPPPPPSLQMPPQAHERSELGMSQEKRGHVLRKMPALIPSGNPPHRPTTNIPIAPPIMPYGPPQSHLRNERDGGAGPSRKPTSDRSHYPQTSPLWHHIPADATQTIGPEKTRRPNSEYGPYGIIHGPPPVPVIPPQFAQHQQRIQQDQFPYGEMPVPNWIGYHDGRLIRPMHPGPIPMPVPQNHNHEAARLSSQSHNPSPTQQQSPQQSQHSQSSPQQAHPRHQSQQSPLQPSQSSPSEQSTQSSLSFARHGSHPQPMEPHLGSPSHDVEQSFDSSDSEMVVPAANQLHHRRLFDEELNTWPAHYYKSMRVIRLDNGTDDAAPRIELIGDLIGMMRDWDVNEIKASRRLVRFRRVQSGRVIKLFFEPISEDEYDESMCVISCIWNRNTHEYCFTSVDCIYLLEAVIDKPFPVEEKNRVRRNLEVCRPTTVSKNKFGYEMFFKQIMTYDHPRPRTIEKDVKVFAWKMLDTALRKIISKYDMTETLVRERIVTSDTTSSPLLITQTPISGVSAGNSEEEVSGYSGEDEDANEESNSGSESEDPHGENLTHTDLHASRRNLSRLNDSSEESRRDRHVKDI